MNRLLCVSGIPGRVFVFLHVVPGTYLNASDRLRPILATRDEIVTYLNELLDPEQFDDLCPNGLQVPGTGEVGSVICGVSGHLELFKQARDAGAEMVLVHHGILWDFQPRRISGQMAERLKTLLEPGINLVAYHLPLDAHPYAGNNSLLCRGLNLEREDQPFGSFNGQSIGCTGRTDNDLTVNSLSESIERLLGREPLVFDFGPGSIERVGFVSGAGCKAIPEAVEAGLDALVTGEAAEHAMADAREGGIHLIAAGHYHTEKLGVQELGKLLADKFGVKQAFIDIPNPV